MIGVSLKFWYVNGYQQYYYIGSSGISFDSIIFDSITSIFTGIIKTIIMGCYF